MSDDRPKCQLRVTESELYLLLKATHEPRYKASGRPVVHGLGERWTTEDERVNAAVKVLAPDLVKELGRAPVLFQIVVVRPAWLLTSGEVMRWTRETIPEGS